jgi:ComEC/Rec2-related protein
MREEVEARSSASLIIGLILGLIGLKFVLAFGGLAGFLIWLRPIRAKILVGSAFVCGLILSPSPPPVLQTSLPIHGVGDVSSVPLLYPDAQVCEVRLNGRILLLTLPRNPGVMLGDKVSISGIVKPTQANLSSRRPTDLAEGRVQMDRVEVVQKGSWVAHFADGWRRSFMEFLDRNLSSKSAKLVDAVCFNSRRMLDRQTKDAMSQSGTVHIVSASGLQVFVLGAMLTMLLRFFPVPKWMQILLLASVLVVYDLAAGLQPQIVRAATMTILGLGAYLARRDPDALSALSVSGILYLLWRPESVFGMAFQLSFVTVACIALFFQRTPPVTHSWKDEVIRLSNEFLKLSAIVVLATAPLVAYYLGVFSVISIFANLMTCWTMPLIVTTAFFAHGLSLGVPSLGDAVATHFLSPLTGWVYGALDLMGDGSGAIQVPHFNALWLVAFYGAWLMTYRRAVVQP